MSLAGNSGTGGDQTGGVGSSSSNTLDPSILAWLLQREATYATKADILSAVGVLPQPEDITNINTELTNTYVAVNAVVGSEYLSDAGGNPNVVPTKTILSIISDASALSTRVTNIETATTGALSTDTAASTYYLKTDATALETRVTNTETVANAALPATTAATTYQLQTDATTTNTTITNSLSTLTTNLTALTAATTGTALSTTLQSQINDQVLLVTNQNTRIVSLETDNTANKPKVTSLQTDNTSNKNRLTTLETDNTTNKADIVTLKAATGTSGTLYTTLTTLTNDNTFNKQRLTALEGDNTTNKNNITGLGASTVSLQNQSNNILLALQQMAQLQGAVLFQGSYTGPSAPPSGSFNQNTYNQLKIIGSSTVFSKKLFGDGTVTYNVTQDATNSNCSISMSSSGLGAYINTTYPQLKYIYNLNGTLLPSTQLKYRVRFRYSPVLDFSVSGASISLFVGARTTAGGGSFGSDTAAIYSSPGCIHQLNQASSTYGIYASTLSVTTQAQPITQDMNIAVVLQSVGNPGSRVYYSTSDFEIILETALT